MHVCVCVYVFIYTQNNYTQYYVNTNFYFGCNSPKIELSII